MAKNFLQLFSTVKETVYSSGVSALAIMASQNQTVKFTRILAPNGENDITKTAQYTFQRRKRPRINTVANVNTGTTTDALKALDQLQMVEWETSTVITGVLRTVGFKKTFNDDFNFDTEGTHKEDMKYQVGEVATQRHKDILGLLRTAPTTAKAIPAYVKGDTLVWQEIAAQVETLAAVDNEYKDIQNFDDFVIVGSPAIARELTLEMGVAFQNEVAIAQVGFNSKNSINGTPFIRDSRLAAREVIILHRESLGFLSEQVKESVNIDLGLNAYSAIYFYDVLTIVDDARIKQLKA